MFFILLTLNIKSLILMSHQKLFVNKFFVFCLSYIHCQSVCQHDYSSSKYSFHIAISSGNVSKI